MECRVRGIHQLSGGRQSTRSTDGLAGVSVRRLAAKMDSNVVRVCSRAFACSLVSPSSVGLVGAEGGVPELADLLTE